MILPSLGEVSASIKNGGQAIADDGSSPAAIQTETPVVAAETSRPVDGPTELCGHRASCSWIPNFHAAISASVKTSSTITSDPTRMG